MLNNKNTKYQKRNDEKLCNRKTQKTQKKEENVKIPRKRKERAEKCGNECGERQSFYPRKLYQKTDTYCNVPTKVFHASLFVACSPPSISTHTPLFL